MDGTKNFEKTVKARALCQRGPEWMIKESNYLSPKEMPISRATCTIW